MKLETLLDKMVWAEDNKEYLSYRAQILRMFEEKDKRIAELEVRLEHYEDEFLYDD